MRRKISLQLSVLFTFSVQIVVKYKGVERLRIIKEEHVQAALRSLLNNASPHAVLMKTTRKKC
jgi:hypothetical protein